MVNEIFPSCQCDDVSDGEDEYRYERSDASRTADEDATTDDELGNSDNEIQFKIDERKRKSTTFLPIQID